jgi:hypothetical protein
MKRVLMLLANGVEPLEMAFELLERLTDRDNVADLRLKMRIPQPDVAWYQTPQV